MAKKSMVNREVKRAKLVKQHATKRAALKAVIYDQTKPMEERFKATPEAGHSAPQLVGRADPQPLPADGPSACVLSQAETQSRIMLRELASFGQIPGMVKSSW
jgi:small subunit ribosomal protein S14